MPFYYQSHGKPAPNGFVALVRKIYNPLGFKRGYNFPLWFLTAFTALGFSAYRAKYLDYDNTYKNAKWAVGDWESQSHGRWRVGMIMHLAAVIPIGFLIPWQFLPVVRYKFMFLHRIIGYILIMLLMVCNAGAGMVMDRAMGGSLEVRAMMALLCIMTTVSVVLAYINIKRLQIDQHRAWMLRCWVYAFAIITIRVLQHPMYLVLERIDFYVTMRCHTIDHILELVKPGLAAVVDPQCRGAPDAVVAVLAKYKPDPLPQGIPAIHQIAAAVQAAFVTAGYMGVFAHAVGVEIYLHLTQAEAARLKRVSRERQLAKGWSRPGDASWLTKETWGDADEFDYKIDVSETMEMGKLNGSREGNSDTSLAARERHVAKQQPGSQPFFPNQRVGDV